MVIESIERSSINPQPISLVIDDDPEFAMQCYEWLNILKDTFPKVKERVAGICFVNDRVYAGVQAAEHDFIRSSEING